MRSEDLKEDLLVRKPMHCLRSHMCAGLDTSTLCSRQAQG